jgi:hypothetical protein
MLSLDGEAVEGAGVAADVESVCEAAGEVCVAAVDDDVAAASVAPAVACVDMPVAVVGGRNEQAHACFKGLFCTRACAERNAVQS